VPSSDKTDLEALPSGLRPRRVGSRFRAIRYPERHAPPPKRWREKDSSMVATAKEFIFNKIVGLQRSKSRVFNNILGYPGGNFKSSFIINNILGYTFILTMVQAYGPADCSRQPSPRVPTILFLMRTVDAPAHRGWAFLFSIAS
jgi:hypothetical protein